MLFIWIQLWGSILTGLLGQIFTMIWYSTAYKSLIMFAQRCLAFLGGPRR